VPLRPHQFRAQACQRSYQPTGKTGTTVCFQPVAHLRAQTGHQQRTPWPGLACMSIRSSAAQSSNYIQILAKALPLRPVRRTLYWMELCLAWHGTEWQSRNPCAPNFGAAATPINHGAAYDRQTLSLTLLPPPTARHPLCRAAPNQEPAAGMRFAAPIWTELFSVYPSHGPFAPADRAGSTTRRRLHHVSPPDMVLSASDRV
jgi:hypothetical protein